MKNTLKIYCFVDDRNSLRDFKKQLNEQGVKHELIIERFDSSECLWVERNKKKYLSDEYVKDQCDVVYETFENRIDLVHFFIPRNEWQNGSRRLLGFQLGKKHNDYFVCVTRLRSRYEETAEHETLHAMDNYIKLFAGINITSILGIKDFDNDIVHGSSYRKSMDRNNKYDSIWKKIMVYLDYAIGKKRTKPVINLVSLKARITPILKSKSIKDNLYTPNNFTIKELVSREIYNKFGEKAWQFFDERLLRNLQHLRELLGKPVYVNDWKDFSYRGFDASEYRIKGTSQHNHGRAIDCHAKGMTAQELRDFVIKNQASFPEPNMWIEDNVNWLHFDVRHREKKGIHICKV